MSVIFHITTRDALLKARRDVPEASPGGSGVYRAESLSGQGFIHFSSLHQLLDVADRFYRGLRGLVILEVDPARLRAELKFEPPDHPAAAGTAPVTDQLFPHLYGPLNLDAVVAVYDFEPNAGGDFSLPAELLIHPDR